MAPLRQISGNRQLRSETTPQERAVASAVRHCGNTWRRAAQAVNKPKSTIRQIVKQKEGTTFENKARTGRPTCLTDRQKRTILRKIGIDCKIDYKELLLSVGLTPSNRKTV